MKQPRERKTAVPLAKKEMTRNEQIAAGGRNVRASHKKQASIITKEGGEEMETKTGFGGLDIKNVSEDVTKFMKFSLDTTFDNVARLQELNEQIIRNTVEAGKKAQAEAEKMMNEFIENGKKGWDEYRRVVSDGFKKVEELIQPTK
jgi:hypothetical protein